MFSLLSVLIFLYVLEHKRGIEVEVRYPFYGYIDLEHGLTTSGPLPKSITLLQTVQVSSSCTSVCQYEGNTYVGLHNQTIDRIDGSYQLSKSFLSGFSNNVVSVRVYKDRVYSLVHGNPYKVDG